MIKFLLSLGLSSSHLLSEMEKPLIVLPHEASDRDQGEMHLTLHLKSQTPYLGAIIT